ncbi:outer membrane protein assembly factor BamD [Geobacter sp. DSM 9736]|uniref:outer membrane protein assembly factor BamD n=1 Tax=Geobacter sp. DSM 9736 TaxID=1277350 RepID=UPI000B50F8D0|nr:outer membrane protein assembly factor BamD [Geobacter sp. DSM 9736]SNB46775.1 Beta-barrel assembly machine subunit BamD [Geobacter sp. DSM 9736]
MPTPKFAVFSLLLILAGCASAPPVNKTADTYFKEGEEAYASKRYEDAIDHWKKVKESYVSPELTTRAELNIADAHFENGNYIEAAAAYEDFRKLHPNHEKAPYALYRLGLCYYQQISGSDTDQTPVTNAATTFESFLRQYPASEYAQEVKEKLKSCQAKQFQYEVYVARFYLRTDKYEAAIQRIQDAFARFPETEYGDEALYYLGQAYLLSGEKVKGREAFTRLTNEFATSSYVEKAKKFMEKYY